MDTKRNTGKETKKMVKNEMDLRFDARSENEAFARVAVAGFVSVLNPTLEEIEDVKTAVSEAVTNAVIHGYKEQGGTIEISCVLEKDLLKMEITDQGCGIENVEQAMEPMFTTGDAEERAGLGFAVMQSFMDKVKVSSTPGRGTRVTLTKRLDARA
mgnify:CR=1 FL=1